MPDRSTPKKQEQFISFHFKTDHVIAKKAASGTLAIILAHEHNTHISGFSGFPETTGMATPQN